MRNAARPQMVRTAVIETTESSNRYVKNVNSYVTLYSSIIHILFIETILLSLYFHCKPLDFLQAQII